MMEIRNLLAGVMLSLVAMNADAASVVIDFNALAESEVITGTDLGGVVITSGTDVVNTQFGPNGTIAIRTDPFTNGSLFLAVFDMPVVSVSVDIGDFGGDEDKLSLEAFDATNTLVGSDTATLAPSSGGLVTLSVSGVGIKSVLFGSSLTDTFPNSVYADNLTFTTSVPPGVVPLPPAVLLLASAFAAVGLVRVRRR